jgi:hypothetical protein
MIVIIVIAIILFLLSQGAGFLVNFLQSNGAEHQQGEYVCHFKTFLKANDWKQRTLSSSCHVVIIVAGTRGYWLVGAWWWHSDGMLMVVKIAAVVLVQ